VIATGVLGGRWLADVTPAGDVVPWDGSPVLAWHVAADDRWHSAASEAAVRQVRTAGTPVVETRLRIPSGDAVQRVWSVADGGGITLVSVSNESPLPIAVAFTRGDLLTVRTPSQMPIEGISLPAGSIVLPVGHHATVTVGLSHRGDRGSLPAGLPEAAQVGRGWTTVAERAGRLVTPDPVDEVIAARCDLALRGPDRDDPIALLVGVGQLVRMGEDADGWLPDVAAAAESVGRRARRGTVGWDVAAALDAAVGVAAAAGAEKAQRDLVDLRRRLSPDRTMPTTSPDGVLGLAWQEHRLLDPTGIVLALGWPDAWLGANVEVHDLPAGSFAVRWHGERPAVLWDAAADIVLRAPVVAPDWSGTGRGETLWPSPAVPASGSSFT